MHKLIAVLFIFLMQANTFAQDTLCIGSLSGKVIDEHDRSALEFATIYIIELQRGALSDSKGFYVVSDLCDGTYSVRVSHLGCEPVEAKITVKGKTIKNFYPEHHTEILKDITVTGEKVAEQTTQTRNNVSAEKMEQSKGQSLGDALKNVTGVTTLNSGNSISKPIIHGMHSNRILILNNGIRQEGQQWGVEHAPEVDPFVAGRISVIKGANSVRYGSDAIAGVVLIEAKPLRDSAGIGGEVNFVGMTNGKGGTASAYMDGNFNKLKAFSWRLQGTLKQNGTISAPDYMLVNTAFKEYNFSYALGWKKQKYGAELFYSQFNTTLGIFGASHIGNLTDLNAAFESTVPLETGTFTYEIDRPYQHIEHELVKFKSYVHTGESGKISFTYARQYNLRYEYDKHGPRNNLLATMNKPELQFELTSHTGDLIWEHDRVKNFSGSIGLSGITQGNTYEGRVLIPNFRSYNGGIFWIERWKKNKLEIEAGIRYDYKWLQVYKYKYMGNAIYELTTPVHIFENVTGNLGAIYKIDTTLNLSVNIGSAWRAPSVNELYTNGLHHGAAALEYGNDSLRSERAYNGIFTIRYTPSKKLLIEVSPYYNYISDFIYRQPSAKPVLTIHGAFPAFYYRQADVTLAGCDFYLNHKIGRSIELAGKASILRARNIKEKNWLIMMPSDRYEGELTYSFRPYKRIHSSYLSASFQYVTKQWRVPQNADFVDPPSAYYLVNLHASCSFRINQQSVEIGVSVFNLLDQSYRDYLDRFRYFTDAMGRNISFRLKIPFNTVFKNKKTTTI
jgi:iron complex outermembrane receptor protein